MRKNNKKVKSIYRRKTHKYGIEIPKNIAQVIQLEIHNGNTYWMDAIEKIDDECYVCI